MATDRNFLAYVVEQIGLGERLTSRRLFGEYALYVDGKVVAFVCDNRLFVKTSPAITELAPGLPLGPPYPGAKDHPIADELLDDAHALRELMLATAGHMPPPRPKRPLRAKHRPD
ncbi:TfoX/Sxy family protein [Dokdonella sp.]|uniref:TfoX/Sxy family protein n=1 Tax=Dokdonella sp. TaxID=2291710 RepID=UPI0031C7BA55|nr:TfoX/Sxy family protein [Dokdonella sp.]